MQDHGERHAHEVARLARQQSLYGPILRFCNFFLPHVSEPFKVSIMTPEDSSPRFCSLSILTCFIQLDHWAWPTKAKRRDAAGEGCVLGRASSQALLRTGLAAGCPLAHCKARSDGTGKGMQGQKQLQKEDAGGQAALHPLRRCGCQHTHAHAWRARTPPSGGLSALSPWQPRLSSGARARVGRGRAGSLRDRTARTAAEVGESQRLLRLLTQLR